MFRIIQKNRQNSSRYKKMKSQKMKIIMNLQI
nr:MAG TPA: hypothetical protein [Caudoviricetes sp.]